MIVFGTKAKFKIVDTGKFFCPHCQKERSYERKRGKNYFSLYFIPIFPIGDIGEIIECIYCGRSYQPSVLQQKLSKPMPDVARYLNHVKTKVDQGWSLEYVISDLTVEGLDRDIAQKVVKMALGTHGKKVCPNCGLTYSDTVSGCKECNVLLVNQEG